MSKGKWILTVVISFVVLIGILIGGLKYRISYAKTEVVSISSEDDQYILKVYMIGEPEWPFGSTHCRFDLYKDSKRITKYPFSVQNDGGSVQDTNFKIEWNQDNVQIIVSAEEQQNIEYILYFDGKVESSIR